jgi:hypothetical protein
MNRFDIEEQISKGYNFSQTIKDVSDGIIDQNLSQDDIVNVLNGLSIMLDLHTSKSLDIMKQVCKLDEYNNK